MRHAPGNRGALRQANRRRVPDLLRTQGPLTQADVARRAGLSRSTVSTIVAELLRSGTLRSASLADPTVVVTPAGLLFWQGVMLKILGSGGSILIENSIINDIASGNLTRFAGWVVILVIVGIFAARTWRRDARRRDAGLVAPPPTLALAKILAVLAGGVVIVLLGNYVYAIGGNAEAARRAGVNLARIRTIAFVLASFIAGIAGVVYASRLRSISTALDGGTLVLYAVAAAVIGGTSLFGGRGKPLHGVLGGIVIAAIDNGMGLLGFSAASKYMVTALVLLVAVTIDAVARRGRPTI